MTTPHSDNGPHPGDWRAEYSAIWAGDFVIATVHWEHPNDPHHDVNVRYLAAAKEMAEVLEEIIINIAAPEYLPGWLRDKHLAVLRKVRGQE